MSLYRSLLTVVSLAIALCGLASVLPVVSEASAQVQLPEPLDEAAPVIDPAATGSDDMAIANRLRGIFQEIKGLEGVRVAVDAGVVSLTGIRRCHGGNAI